MDLTNKLAPCLVPHPPDFLPTEALYIAITRSFNLYIYIFIDFFKLVYVHCICMCVFVQFFLVTDHNSERFIPFKLKPFIASLPVMVVDYITCSTEIL